MEWRRRKKGCKDPKERKAGRKASRDVARHSTVP